MGTHLFLPIVTVNVLWPESLKGKQVNMQTMQQSSVSELWHVYLGLYNTGAVLNNNTLTMAKHQTDFVTPRHSCGLLHSSVHIK